MKHLRESLIKERNESKDRHTTPAAPAVMAMGAVTALRPDEHITGILTALEIEYAEANVGVA